MGANFVRIGLTPGMAATHILPAATDPQTAAVLLLTGDLVDADAARAMGLVWSVADSPDATVSAALALARRIAAAAPSAVRMTTRALRMRMDDRGLETALWREADMQAHCYAGGEVLEGVTAVREKRNPNFAADPAPRA